MNNLAQQLTRLLEDLDKLTQQAANRANSERNDIDSNDLKSYFFGVAYGYEDTRDRIAVLLASALKTTVSE
jgi:hypothetical protein